MKASSQPRIGVSCADIETASAQAILKRVSEVGGDPFIISDHGARSPEADLKKIAGLVVMGNDFDIDPEDYIHRYEENDPRRCVHPHTKSETQCKLASARANYENTIIRLALKQKIPMLCICGGMQRLNVLCGGTLHQHVPDMVGDDRLMQRNRNIPGEVPVIPVVIEPATRMAMIASRVQMGFVKSSMSGLPIVIMENSFRHQSIDIVGNGLRVCALSDTIPLPDGRKHYLIEAIEAAPDGPYAEQFLIGVQWHPEFGASQIGRDLIQELIRHAADK